MNAKKIFKIIGIIIAIIIGVLLLLLAFVWGSIEWTRYSKNKEAIRVQKEVCDTITTVDGNFPITVNGFTEKELKTIAFYLKRNEAIIRDTTVNLTPEAKAETQSITMPFTQLNINDWIIVVIGKRSYLLNGFSYVAGYNYGMFGPVGPCECRGGSYENVNGKASMYGVLLKKEGLLNYQLPPIKTH